MISITMLHVIDKLSIKCVHLRVKVVPQTAVF